MDHDEEVEVEVAPKDIDDKSLRAFDSFFKTLSQVHRKLLTGRQLMDCHAAALEQHGAHGV